MIRSGVIFVVLFSMASAQTELETPRNLTFSSCAFNKTKDLFVESFDLIKKELADIHVDGPANELLEKLISESKKVEAAINNVTASVSTQQKACIAAAEKKGKGPGMCNLKAGFKYAFKYTGAVLNYAVNMVKAFALFKTVIVKEALNHALNLIKGLINTIAINVKASFKCMKRISANDSSFAIEGDS